MRKFVLVFCFIAVSTLGWAQKGTFYVGGAVGFNAGDNNTQISLAPEVGTWLSDEIQVGGVVQFATNSDFDPKSRMGLIAYGRKWAKVTDSFSLYYGLMADFHNGENQAGGSFDGFGINLDCGFAYALAPKWGIAGRAGTLGFSSSNGSSYFGLNVSNAPVFNLGIYYTL